MKQPLAPALLAPVFGLLLAACRGESEAVIPDSSVPVSFDSVAIAEPAEALTFARTSTGGTARVLAVSSYSAGVVEAVDVGAAMGRPVADPVSLFVQEGYEALRRRIEDAPAGSRVRVQASDLVQPLELAAEHIAAGTNFPEHAADAGVEDGPFLFAKLVEPTAPRAPVTAGNALLDYEVELAWVTLEPLAEGESPKFMGVIACNDFTDRATLLRHLDPWNVASGDGFSTGKSFPGYLPVGDLLVIPRDYRTFAASLQLRLFVDRRQRQSSPATAMVWDFDEILAQTWARRATKWEHRGAQVSLPGAASGVIPERTMLLAGTPHGTVFDGITTRQTLAGVASWLFGGWGRALPDHVVARYIEDSQASRMYLQPGNEVTIHIDRLGVLTNRVE